MSKLFRYFFDFVCRERFGIPLIKMKALRVRTLVFRSATCARMFCYVSSLQSRREELEGKQRFAVTGLLAT